MLGRRQDLGLGSWPCRPAREAAGSHRTEWPRLAGALHLATAQTGAAVGGRPAADCVRRLHSYYRDGWALLTPKADPGKRVCTEN